MLTHQSEEKKKDPGPLGEMADAGAGNAQDDPGITFVSKQELYF